MAYALLIACSDGQPAPSASMVPGPDTTGLAGSPAVAPVEPNGGTAGAAGAAAVPPAGSAGAGGVGAEPQDMPVAGAAGAAVEPPPVAGTNAEPLVPPAGAGDAADTPFDYVDEQVTLNADLVVAAGETLRVGPGATFTAAAGVTVRVDGTLIIAGSEASPAGFHGAGVPRSWEGIVVAAGGMLEASHVEISGATYGIHALPGASYSVEHADIGKSFKGAVLQADGSFTQTAFHASGDPTFSISSAAPITDPNGTLTIVDASPTVTHSSFDGGAPLVDMVRVRGSASPSFDHLYVTEAHCGIHMEGTPNTAPQITNSVFEGLAYGVMAYAMKPQIEDSVFLANATDVGFCLGATADNTPVLEGNHYSAGAALIDPSCVQIGTVDASPAATPNPSAGPVAIP